MEAAARELTGRSVHRVEDAALVTGRGRFVDDLGCPAGTLHAAILRSPHPHAEVVALDLAAARKAPGVRLVFARDEVLEHTLGLLAAARTPIDARTIATDRVRYVGEPVAVVVAESRYLAEDAVDLIEVDYRPLPILVDPDEALSPDSPLLHPAVGSNVVSDRSFRYGDPERAFESGRRVEIRISYPRNTGSPMETYGVVADYDPHTNSFDILSNFQGPFSIQAVLARALKTSSSGLRLRMPPDSGGSFGTKQGVAPYIVLMGVAAKLCGRPVKWIEDRLEHLAASVAATNRNVTLAASVAPDGRILALDWDQVEDCGAYLRAPEPATLYRMHGNLTGAYDIRHVAVRNRVVVSNKTPTGLVRGFGGPQVYFALERLVQRIGRELDLDPLAVIRRNLVPAEAFPYRTATGGLYDSGDYGRAVDIAVEQGALAELRARQKSAREQGRLYGIGMTAVVEPSVSNMGYITTVLTAAERHKSGPKNGAQATATIGLDPGGGVNVHVASVPQGQGHRTVLAQVVADAFGLKLADIKVITELDTGRDAWSIASGNYSSRFAAAVAGTAHLAATRLRDRLARLAASMLNARAQDILFQDGRVFVAGNPDAGLPFARLAATGHWSPMLVPEDCGDVLRETAWWTPPELAAPTEADEINSSLCHGFIFDFCGVEIDRATGAAHIDRYITMHDCGRVLHPGMVEGQIRGGFVQALGAAFYEELAYGSDGAFLAGTFADYLLPTTSEIPDLEILHIETPSPATPLGAKGVGEGNCMSTPVCLANAVADALGAYDIVLPMTPARLMALIEPTEKAPPAGAPHPVPAVKGGRAMTGEGSTIVAATVDRVWDMLLDADTLAAVIPGCHSVEKISATHFRADVTLGVGPVKGRYKADVKLSDLDPPHGVTLTGAVSGALGSGGGSGRVSLASVPEGARISYTYEASIGGKVAMVGARLLDGAARVVIGQFFAALGNRAAGASPGLMTRLRGWFGGWT